MKNSKEFMHIRISKDIYSKIANVASETFRSIGLTSELIILIGLGAMQKSSNKDVLLDSLKSGGNND